MELKLKIKDLQLRFEDKSESIKVGDILKYHKENDERYFTNQFGFKIATIPVGVKVKTGSFTTIPFSGLSMPECTGVVFLKNGEVWFNRDLIGAIPNFIASEFLDGDEVEIISLPN
jgi:hypothetical protein